MGGPGNILNYFNASSQAAPAAKKGKKKTATAKKKKGFLDGIEEEGEDKAMAEVVDDDEVIILDQPDLGPAHDLVAQSGHGLFQPHQEEHAATEADVQGWKLMSRSHSQELSQRPNRDPFWLQENEQPISSKISLLTQFLKMTTT